MNMKKLRFILCLVCSLVLLRLAADEVKDLQREQEQIRQDQAREQDTAGQNAYYAELIAKGQKLIRLIEKRKNAKNSELNKFLKELSKLVSRWD